MKLIDIVKGNDAVLMHYRSGQLWYRIDLVTNDLVFAVPIDDTGTGTFLPKMKAVKLLRWIRKSLEFQQTVKLES